MAVALLFLGVLVPPGPVGAQDRDDPVELKKRLAGRAGLLDRLGPLITHTIPTARLQLEVDTDANGEVENIRLFFSERDPAVPPEPATISTRPRKTEGPDLGPDSEGSEGADGATIMTLIPPCGGTIDPEEITRALREEELERLERVSGLPVTERGAMRKGVFTLFFGGISLMKLGSDIIKAAAAAPTTTVIFRTAIFGELWLTGSWAAVFAGPVGAAIIVVGGYTVYLAYKAENEFQGKLAMKKRLIAAKSQITVDCGGEVIPPPDPTPTFCTIPDPPIASGLGSFKPQTEEQCGGAWSCLGRFNPDGTLIEHAPPCGWSYPTRIPCVQTGSGAPCSSLPTELQNPVSRCCSSVIPDFWQGPVDAFDDLYGDRWVNTEFSGTPGFGDVLYSFAGCKCNYVIPTYYFDNFPWARQFPMNFIEVPCAKVGDC
jgi:hypothetical protein